ncbi:MAG: NADPH-dependent FMN reductase [Planctomycetota bacterium]|jgi:NAD(P)H-dependent FMN reductase
MSETPRILAFAGSLRAGSYNKKLVRLAAAGAEAAGAAVTVIDLRDYALPIFDEDLEREQGVPENAMKLKELMKAHGGFLIASPEYNSSLSAVLKNTIDWATRPVEHEASLECFAGKVAALVAASPGALGGLRGLFDLRSILLNIRMIVLPDQHALSRAHEAFADDGSLVDASVQQRVEDIGRRLAETVRKLHA